MKRKELAKRNSKLRAITSTGYQRACEAFDKKTTSAIRMMRRAVAKGFKVSFILADSCFFSVALVRFALRKKINLITRPKFNNWKYGYNGRVYTIGQLSKKLRYDDNKKWNKTLRMRHVSVLVMFMGIEMKLFFLKRKKEGRLGGQS